MLRPTETVQDPTTPMPTPLLNVAGLRLDGETPRSDDTAPPPTPPPLPAATPPPPPSPSAALPLLGVAKEVQGGPNPTGVQGSQASRDAFTKRVQTVFAEVMAKGGVLPNEAALLALQQVQSEQL